MRISELKDALSLNVCAKGATDREITGCYIGDMLSVVMSRAEEGDVWLTVQTNVNIAAVSVLCGVACIITVEGMVPDQETIEKAEKEDVTIFTSSETAYELAAKIKELL